MSSSHSSGRPDGDVAGGLTIYEQVQASEEFQDLRSRFRRFVFSATAFFVLWYALYVALAAFAPEFMSIKVAGNINIGLIFGLLQFVTTFGLAYMYSRFSSAKLDPLARDLEQSYRDQVGTTGRRGQ